MKPIEIKTYQCPICDEIHSTIEKAEKCIAQGIPEPIVEVGDIVELRYGFGWFEGKEEWVINPEIGEQGDKIDLVKKNHIDVPGDRQTNCFGSCCTMGFYYVVTKIELDKERGHILKYHIYTKAMTGNKGYREGYTYADTHVKPTKVENPPEFVVEDSKDLIGKEARWLL